jgi:hypothetical protein
MLDLRDVRSMIKHSSTGWNEPRCWQPSGRVPRQLSVVKGFL